MSFRRFRSPAGVAAVCLAYAALPLMAQAPSAALKFDVASVKVAESPMSTMQAGRGMVSGAPVFSGTRVDIGSMAMTNLIATAYHQDVRRITGPAWMSQSFFAIQAVMPEGATKEQFPEMLKALLEERFHLVARLAVSDQTAYALTVAKNGHKLKSPREVDRSGCDTWRDDPQFSGAQTCNVAQTTDGTRTSLTIRTDSKFGPSRTSISKTTYEMEFYGITMSQLTEYLTTTVMSGPSNRAQVPFTQVIDRTDLPGKWDVTVERVFEDVATSPEGGPVIPIPITPTLIANELTAGLSKVGLKLEKTTAPVEMLVVDHLDQVPTEN